MSWSRKTSTANRSIPVSIAATSSRLTGWVMSIPETSPAKSGFIGRMAMAISPSRLLVEAGRVVPEELAPGVRLEARPGENVVHRVGELALRVRIVGGVHQDIVSEHAGHVVEQILALVALDGAEEAPAGQILAR